MQHFLAPEMIARIGERLGVRVELEPEFGHVGQIIRPDGRVSYFRNTNFDINGQGAAEIARDKAYASYFMARLGYSVPEGRSFFSPQMLRWSGAKRGSDAAHTYARELGFPVIVKPNSGSQGRAVARVWNRRELERALRAVFVGECDNVALIQRPAPGDDYRLVVLDSEVVCAYKRTPLSVVGDGSATIRALLERKHADYAASGRDTTIPLDDFRIPVRLARLGLHLGSVPAPGERISLMDNANLSTGGEATDVSEAIHPAYRALAVSITRDMGLRYCGLDIMTPAPIEEAPGHYVALEANPAPGLDHYAQLGPKQAAVVETMYEKILRAL